MEKVSGQNSWLLRSKSLDLQSPKIMGILNVTPDSFSDGGRFLDPVLALEKAQQMQEEGADIVDVGAESTRPGAPDVEPQAEWRRIEFLLPSLVAKIQIPISLDTRHPFVAQRALEAGVEIINDVSCAQNNQLLDLVAKYDAAYVLMHSRGNPQTMKDLINYQDLILEIKGELTSALRKTQDHGIALKKIVLDPGLGFAKTPEHNFQILSRLKELQTFDLPILVGLSRKRMFQNFLGNDLESLDEATAVANIFAWQQGAGLFRVHDVKKTKIAFETWRRCELQNE